MSLDYLEDPGFVLVRDVVGACAAVAEGFNELCSDFHTMPCTLRTLCNQPSQTVSDACERTFLCLVVDAAVGCDCDTPFIEEAVCERFTAYSSALGPVVGPGLRHLRNDRCSVREGDDFSLLVLDTRNEVAFNDHVRRIFIVSHQDLACL